MSEPIIEHVSDTALWVASYRARESDRKDALFYDPFAKLLAGERGADIARRMQHSKMTEWSVVIRTRVIDDLLRERISAGADCVLNLGAGLDTRPYRLDLPASLVWIEVDYPHMVKLKEEKLANEKPRCVLRRSAVDLSDKAARESFLADTARELGHIVVLTEGVIPYLSPSEVTTLAGDLVRHAQYRFWILDYYTKAMHRYFKTAKRARQMGDAMFKFFVDDWHAFFAGLGWKPKEIRYYVREAEKLGRSMPLPWLYKLFIKMMPAEKKKASAEWSGYALLEPASR